jgi:maleylpyruvate isomerase
VLSHLARNADGLRNLVEWARTGVESPMYASSDERAEGIDAGAERPLDEHLADLSSAAERFRDAAVTLPADRRAVMVRGASGRELPAHEVLWLRVRETWLHAVDIDAGFVLDGVPDDIARCLVLDLCGWHAARGVPSMSLELGDGVPVELGIGDPTTVVSGSPQAVAGWLTGRSGPEALTATAGFPELPRWL